MPRDAALVCLLPETALTRRLLRLPRELRPARRKKQALALLASAMRGPCGAYRLDPLSAEDGGTLLIAAIGVRRDRLEPLRHALGKWDSRMTYADGTALHLPTEPRDGYLTLTGAEGEMVLALREGRIIDGRSTADGAGASLYQLLLAEHAAFSGAVPASQLHYGMLSASPRADETAEAALTATGTVSAGLNRRLTVLLVLLCVVLPLTAQAGLTAFREPPPEAGQTTEAAVSKSHYSRLSDTAAAAQTERVRILSQQAAGGSLRVTGTCPDMLDLADYMQRITDGDPSCSPLLEEAIRIPAEDDKMCYNFVIQISEGGDPS